MYFLIILIFWEKRMMWNIPGIKRHSAAGWIIRIPIIIIVIIIIVFHSVVHNELSHLIFGYSEHRHLYNRESSHRALPIITKCWPSIESLNVRAKLFRPKSITIRYLAHRRTCVGMNSKQRHQKLNSHRIESNQSESNKRSTEGDGEWVIIYLFAFDLCRNRIEFSHNAHTQTHTTRPLGSLQAANINRK